MDQRSLDRRPQYKDVELLIDQGFITHSVAAFGVSLTFRSLFPQEIRNITHQTYNKGVSTYRTWIVTKALYSVSGWVIEENVPIYDLVQRFPKRLRNNLYYRVLGLMNRYQRSMELAQAYSYESYGRHSWYTNGRKIPTNAFNMINGVQTLWQFVNIIEDRFENSEMHWNHAKFIASAMSPKGVKKQMSKDEQAKKKRDAEREEYIVKSLRYLKTQNESDKPILVNAKTDDELMDEYKRWVAGDQDNHDLIVQNYKDRIRLGMEERDRQAAQRIQELMGDGERGVFSATRIAGEEAKEVFKGNTRQLGHEGSQKRLYKRFLGREEVGGDFYVDNAGQVRKR